MGQEVSQQRPSCKSYNREQFPAYSNKNNHHYIKYMKQKNCSAVAVEKPDSYHEKCAKFSKVKVVNGHNSYLKHKEPIYTSSSISNSSSTDDEEYKHYQKYNLTKQSYEKSRISKQHQQLTSGNESTRKSRQDSSYSSSSDYHTYFVEGVQQPKSHSHYQRSDTKCKLQRNKSSHSTTTTDSGIYYSSGSSSLYTPPPLEGYSLCNYSVKSGRTSELDSQKSRKSLAKQKEYLEHHLYIKSYLDILEEDEKARAEYKVAKPGGIRNYKPKILSDISLSTSAPVRNEDPWI